MDGFTVFSPTRVVFGSGCLSRVGNCCAEYAKKALVVSDKNIKRLGLAERIFGELEKAGVSLEIFDDVVENPLAENVDQLKEATKSLNIGMIVAVGGGSVIDTAKGVALVYGNPLNCWDYCIRTDYEVPNLESEPLPIVAIPTTAGTGSEVTPFAVLTNRETRIKSAIVSDGIFPRVALVDPELTLSMPPSLTAFTGIDALSHAIEAYINRHSTPFSEMLSMESLRLISSNLRRAFNNGEDLNAREGMAWASTLAGFAITHSATTLAHAVGQSISGLTNAPHGATMAAALPEVMDFAVSEAPEKFAAIAEVLDIRTRRLPLHEKAKRSVQLVARLINDVGAKVRFRDYGLDETGLERAVQVAIDTLQANIEPYPRDVSKEEILSIYRKCL
jgi:alcohol dehydrogenase class IV